MSTKRPLLTPTVEKMIVAYVRAGGYPHVAAEAAGVSREVFEEWLRKGEAGRPLKYKHFVEALRQAEAQARLNAEVAAFKDKPMDWLKAGPGKETAGPARLVGPGQAAARAPRRKRRCCCGTTCKRFSAPCCMALEPHPEARAAVAAVLVRLREGEQGT